MSGTPLASEADWLVISAARLIWRVKPKRSWLVAVGDTV